MLSEIKKKAPIQIEYDGIPDLLKFARVYSDLLNLLKEDLSEEDLKKVGRLFFYVEGRTDESFTYWRLWAYSRKEFKDYRSIDLIIIWESFKDDITNEIF